MWSRGWPPSYLSRWSFSLSTCLLLFSLTIHTSTALPSKARINSKRMLIQEAPAMDDYNARRNDRERRDFFAAGRQIQPIECTGKDGQEKGVCMFAWNCVNQGGKHLGTCIDRFYFGSCCKLPDGVSPTTMPTTTKVTTESTSTTPEPTTTETTTTTTTTETTTTTTESTTTTTESTTTTTTTTTTTETTTESTTTTSEATTITDSEASEPVTATAEEANASSSEEESNEASDETTVASSASSEEVDSTTDSEKTEEPEESAEAEAEASATPSPEDVQSLIDSGALVPVELPTGFTQEHHNAVQSLLEQGASLEDAIAAVSENMKKAEITMQDVSELKPEDVGDSPEAAAMLAMMQEMKKNGSEVAFVNVNLTAHQGEMVQSLVDSGMPFEEALEAAMSSSSIAALPDGLGDQHQQAIQNLIDQGVPLNQAVEMVQSGVDSSILSNNIPPGVAGVPTGEVGEGVFFLNVTMTAEQEAEVQKLINNGLSIQEAIEAVSGNKVEINQNVDNSVAGDSSDNKDEENVPGELIVPGTASLTDEELEAQIAQGNIVPLEVPPEFDESHMALVQNLVEQGMEIGAAINAVKGGMVSQIQELSENGTKIENLQVVEVDINLPPEKQEEVQNLLNQGIPLQNALGMVIAQIASEKAENNTISGDKIQELIDSGSPIEQITNVPEGLNETHQATIQQFIDDGLSLQAAMAAVIAQIASNGSVQANVEVGSGLPVEAVVAEEDNEINLDGKPLSEQSYKDICGSQPWLNEEFRAKHASPRTNRRFRNSKMLRDWDTRAAEVQEARRSSKMAWDWKELDKPEWRRLQKKWDYYREGKIVNGERSEYGEWPWQVSLRQWRSMTYLHKCGAALLSENWAITAAHCVEGVEPDLLLLRMGEYDLDDQFPEPYSYQDRKVSIIITHQQFDPRTFEYDLALLRFQEPVKFQPNIIPICIPDSDEDLVGRTAWVTGWGRLYEDGPLPSLLQKVDLPIINNTQCENMYEKAGYREHIPNIFICAGYKEGGKDSCEGDSGGPLVIKRQNDRKFMLTGVISWGIGCAEKNQPGVYTRISRFRQWISEIIQF